MSILYPSERLSVHGEGSKEVVFKDASETMSDCIMDDTQRDWDPHSRHAHQVLVNGTTHYWYTP